MKRLISFTVITNLLWIGMAYIYLYVWELPTSPSMVEYIAYAISIFAWCIAVMFAVTFTLKSIYIWRNDKCHIKKR